MTDMLVRWFGGLLCAFTLSAPQTAQAQAADTGAAPAGFAQPGLAQTQAQRTPTGVAADHGVGRPVVPASEPAPPREAVSRFHDSLLVLDQSITTQTVGVGSQYLSDNPTYDITLRLWPRFYLVENERRDLSLRLDFRLAREFTNSDTTTRRGEWAPYDTELWLAWFEHLRRVENQRTSVLIRFPYLVVPTSKASAGSGRILGVGIGTGIDQEVPLRGPGAYFLPKGKVSARINYSYHFARSNVATNDTVQRVRVDPEGRSAPSDQLSGSALPQHVVLGSLRFETALVEKLGWSADFGFRYDRRYALTDDVDVCNLGTGCVAPIRLNDASRSTVRTIFATELMYTFNDYLAASLGYINIAAQLGEDGQRRSLFYSPWARFYVSLGVTLDAAYRAASGRRPPPAAAQVGPARAF
ncbi:MAG TPA: hypothetical protein VFQ61_29925 [Polyangiaceae bacterium]|nr:hypothetical protein [Polyangiaceae bacterium]